MSEQPPSTPSSGGGGQVKNPFQGLNVDKVKNAGLPTQLMLGGAIVFFIFAFDWWSYDVPGTGVSVSANAFDNYRGWLAWILMIGVAVVALLLLAGSINQYRQQLVYGAVAGAGLATLLTLWYMAADQDYHGVTTSAGSNSFGVYIAFIAAIAATAGAVLNMLEFQKKSA